VTRHARTRVGERGFTLVEVLVSLALLTIIGTVVGVVFSIGMRTILAPGASQDRLAAASNAIAFEEPLTEDMHRASCIYFPNVQQDAGSCDGTNNVHFQSDCGAGSGLLCIEWPDLAANTTQCDVALYDLSAIPVYRQEWVGSTAVYTSFPGVSVTILGTSPGPPLELDVKVTSSGPHPASPPASPLANDPPLTLDLQSLTDLWPTLPPSAAPAPAVFTSPC
jgi:prepilin-type N-terminal cleavage/methylation domain-containing protein